MRTNAKPVPLSAEPSSLSFFTRRTFVVLSGLLLRALVFAIVQDEHIRYLTTRFEVLSPITAHTRLVEGHALLSSGIDPYASGFFKLSPIFASLIFPFLQSIPVMFSCLVLLDSASTWMLMSVLGTKFGVIGGVAFFLNPFVILSELGLSAESVAVFLVALFLNSALTKPKGFNPSVLCLSLLAVLKPSPAVFSLIFPLALLHNRSLLPTISKLLASLVGLHALSYMTTGGSLTYLHATILSPLQITSDLEPNVGFFWSVFALVFPGSVPLFRLIFFLHFPVLTWITWIQFKKSFARELHVRFLVLCAAGSLVFDPYPTAIDHMLAIPLLVACDQKWIDKTTLIAAQAMFIGLGFASIMATNWIDRHTGNQNFLFSLGMVANFGSVVAIGQSLKIARLHEYTPKAKKLD